MLHLGRTYIPLESFVIVSLSSWGEHVASGSRILVNGVETFYVDRGSGKVVVLIHGWASSSFSWRYNIHQLSNSLRVIAPDLPGFGLSKPLSAGLHLDSVVKHIARFLEILDVGKFSLVGHSMGGIVAAYLATRSVDNVEKLVLINPSFFVTEDGRMSFIMKIARRRPWGGILSRFLISKFFIRYALKRVYVKKHVVDDMLVEGYYESVKNADASLLDAVNISREFSLDVLSGIKCPVLFILGKLDTLVSCAKNNELAERIGARVFVDEGSGHNVHEESPEEVNRVIIDFLSNWDERYL